MSHESEDVRPSPSPIAIRGLLMTPSRPGQEAVLRQAYRLAAVSPREVQYVEAHGTGPLAGDPVEAGALGAVLGAGRPADRPCGIGSIKTNIGHTEAAAGVAGLIKAASISGPRRALEPAMTRRYVSVNPRRRVTSGDPVRDGRGRARPR
jgi:3-oxoacyl-(acyl-carrier-protein) synthase